ncbi:MAG: transcriptional regulator [Kiritimatiellae bacterium]|jgi:DNA-binding transcriptional ArsR family regulator|nr:transcriptional regulator [Kiritimatiellia bacterium]MBR3922440.1 transcriptional regulator [Kiritimatiellia bacterium]
MKNELKPTLWRTARALANSCRLNLMRLVANAKGAKGVCELATEANLSVSATSTYLRALNARGLISVIRSGSFVYYGTGSDRSLPIAVAIQGAFRRLFAKKELPDDWQDILMPILNAYSNQRRESMVRILSEHNRISYLEFHKRSGLCETSFLRHLRILANAGIVSLDSNGLYSLAKPRNSLEAIFLAESSGQSLPPHFAKCGGKNDRVKE